VKGMRVYDEAVKIIVDNKLLGLVGFCAFLSLQSDTCCFTFCRVTVMLHITLKFQTLLFGSMSRVKR
jgi:nicotinamide riboside transporter PnuC